MKNNFYLRLKSVILLLLLFLLMAISMVGMAQTVTTNKADYLPGEKVIVTGTGWLAGETVNVAIDHKIFDHPDQYLFAIADASGNIFNDQYIIAPTDLGELFLLTATGQSSGFIATTTFTDANQSANLDQFSNDQYSDYLDTPDKISSVRRNKLTTFRRSKWLSFAGSN